MKKVQVAFLALDPYLEKNIPSPVEKELQGKDMMQWGDRNLYPEFLWDLYGSVTTLRTIINGTRDFCVGDAQAFQLEGLPAGIVNTKGETIKAFCVRFFLDRWLYGGAAIQVIRSRAGNVAEIYNVPMRYLRMNKECDVFYYSEKWAKAGTKKTTVYPAFMPISPERWNALAPEEKERSLSSILLVKDTNTQTYPTPVYAAAVKACDTERNIDEFHLNSVNNGFTSSMVVNFNNGQPDSETKAEIEKNFTEKFTGSKNAGRVMFSFNPDVKNATTFTSPKVESFGERYEALSKNTERRIFTAFRATPVLFGIPTDNNGFAADDYANAFRLYNRTAVRPAQAELCDALDRITGKSGSLVITPFSLDEGAEKNVQ